MKMINLEEEIYCPECSYENYFDDIELLSYDNDLYLECNECHHRYKVLDEKQNNFEVEDIIYVTEENFDINESLYKLQITQCRKDSLYVMAKYLVPNKTDYGEFNLKDNDGAGLILFKDKIKKL